MKSLSARKGFHTQMQVARAEVVAVVVAVTWTIFIECIEVAAATMVKEQTQMDALRQKTYTDYVQAAADLEQGPAGFRGEFANMLVERQNHGRVVKPRIQSICPF